jgi:hypothetical protein
MTRNHFHKLWVMLVVVALLSMVGCSAINPPPEPTHTPIPTPTPLPEQKPPPIQGWQGVTVETLCLENEFNLREGLGEGREVTGEFTDPTVETLRSFLSDLGIRVVEPGEACDASMLIETLVITHTVSYTGGGFTSCYAAGELNSSITLTKEGQETIFQPMTVKEPPPSKILASTCQRLDKPEKFLAYIVDDREEQLVDALVQLWGRQALVWMLDKLTVRKHPNVITNRLMAGAPSDEIILALLYAIQSDNPKLKTAAYEALGDFAPQGPQAIPFLAQTALDQNDEFAFWVLAEYGPYAMDTVPLFIQALQEVHHKIKVEEKYTSEDLDRRIFIVDTLKAITGEDKGTDPNSWNYWWEKER